MFIYEQRSVVNNLTIRYLYSGTNLGGIAFRTQKPTTFIKSLITLPMKTLKLLVLTLLVNISILGQTQSQVNAGKVWSLRECVDYAWANNLAIKQRDLQIRSSEANLLQSKLQQTPNINASANYGFNTGRSIDPFTNAFVQQTFRFNSIGLNANVPIFQGFQVRNSIKQGSLTVKATQLERDQARQDVALNTVLAYLNVLNNDELVSVARLQVETTRGQVARTDKLVKAGSLPVNDLYDLQSQLANDELALVNAENEVRIAKVNLMQTMNLPVAEGFSIEKIRIPDPDQQPYPQTTEEIYKIALENQPGIKAATTRIESSKYAVRVARGGLYPTLSAFGNLNTNYVSSAPDRLFTPDGTRRDIFIPDTVYNSSDGTNRQILYRRGNVPNGRFDENTYFRQLEFNLGSSYGLSLNIPILGGWVARTRITQAVIQQKQAEVTEQQTKVTLRQNIEQAYNNMTASAQRFRANSEAVRAQDLAFQATRIRFENGLLNSVDFSLSQTRLGVAKANQVNARYDYVFRMKILDFYQNKPLTFD